MIRNLSDLYQNKVSNYIPGGVHYNFQNPFEVNKIHFIKGNGTRVYDLDGNEYIDFFCKFGANILGHNNTKYIAGIRESLEYITSTSLAYNEYEVSQKICELIPSAEKVRYCLSGTEAVQNALRLSRAYTGKNKFVRFKSHYHGSADNIMGGLSDSENPIPRSFHGDPKGTWGRASDVMSSQSYLIDWNDETILENIINEKHNEIASIIMEPICVNGLIKFPKEGYLKKVRQLCDDNNIVLIFDEVITGFRVSAGGAQKYLGVYPDITVLGKALGGGSLPISAIAGKKEIMDLYSKSKVVHANTFNGYTLGLTASKLTLDILTENKYIYTNMENEILKILNSLKSVGNEYGFNINILGHPSCSSFDCTSWDSQMKNREILNLIISKSMLEEGVLLSNKTTLYSNISINNEDVFLFESRLPRIFEKSIEKIKHLR